MIAQIARWLSCKLWNCHRWRTLKFLSRGEIEMDAPAEKCDICGKVREIKGGKKWDQ
jgi:hypothetical protein